MIEYYDATQYQANSNHIQSQRDIIAKYFDSYIEKDRELISIVGLGVMYGITLLSYLSDAFDIFRISQFKKNSNYNDELPGLIKQFISNSKLFKYIKSHANGINNVNIIRNGLRKYRLRSNNTLRLKPILSMNDSINDFMSFYQSTSTYVTQTIQNLFSKKLQYNKIEETKPMQLDVWIIPNMVADVNDGNLTLDSNIKGYQSIGDINSNLASLKEYNDEFNYIVLTQKTDETESQLFNRGIKTAKDNGIGLHEWNGKYKRLIIIYDRRTQGKHVQFKEATIKQKLNNYTKPYNNKLYIFETTFIEDLDNNIPNQYYSIYPELFFAKSKKFLCVDNSQEFISSFNCLHGFMFCLSYHILSPINVKQYLYKNGCTRLFKNDIEHIVAPMFYGNQQINVLNDLHDFEDIGFNDWIQETMDVNLNTDVPERFQAEIELKDNDQATPIVKALFEPFIKITTVQQPTINDLFELKTFQKIDKTKLNILRECFNDEYDGLSALEKELNDDYTEIYEAITAIQFNDPDEIIQIIVGGLKSLKIENSEEPQYKNTKDTCFGRLKYINTWFVKHNLCDETKDINKELSKHFGKYGIQYSRVHMMNDETFIYNNHRNIYAHKSQECIHGNDCKILKKYHEITKNGHGSKWSIQHNIWLQRLVNFHVLSTHANFSTNSSITPLPDFKDPDIPGDWNDDNDNNNNNNNSNNNNSNNGDYNEQNGNHNNEKENSDDESKGDNNEQGKPQSNGSNIYEWYLFEVTPNYTDNDDIKSNDGGKAVDRMHWDINETPKKDFFNDDDSIDILLGNDTVLIGYYWYFHSRPQLNFMTTFDDTSITFKDIFKITHKRILCIIRNKNNEVSKSLLVLDCLISNICEIFDHNYDKPINNSTKFHGINIQSRVPSKLIINTNISRFDTDGYKNAIENFIQTNVNIRTVFIETRRTEIQDYCRFLKMQLQPKLGYLWLFSLIFAVDYINLFNDIVHKICMGVTLDQNNNNDRQYRKWVKYVMQCFDKINYKQFKIGYLGIPNTNQDLCIKKDIPTQFCQLTKAFSSKKQCKFEYKDEMYYFKINGSYNDKPIINLNFDALTATFINNWLIYFTLPTALIEAIHLHNTIIYCPYCVHPRTLKLI